MTDHPTPVPLYDRPDVYDLAFSFREYAAEAGFYADCFDAFGDRPVRRVLDLACGPAPHLPAWHDRGIEYVGVDASAPMIDAARERAVAAGADPELHVGDAMAVALDRPVDAAYCALSSWYVADRADLRTHLRAVADVLVPGGVYLAEACVTLTGQVPRDGEWIETGYGEAVHVRAGETVVDPGAQLVERRLTCDRYAGDDVDVPAGRPGGPESADGERRPDRDAAAAAPDGDDDATAAGDSATDGDNAADDSATVDDSNATDATEDCPATAIPDREPDERLAETSTVKRVYPDELRFACEGLPLEVVAFRNALDVDAPVRGVAPGDLYRPTVVLRRTED